MNLDTTIQQVEELTEKLQLLKQEIHQRIIGQEEAVEQLLITFLAGGHALLEGVPGLAKTLMVRTLGQATDLHFNRVQFTPDLMPTDILGTEVLEEDPETGKRQFKFSPGPVFSNLLLADEINRTPPKTQAALLEAMQEYEVTYAGKTYALPRPFFILATQNPIEQAGTFPLPEAQLDRFLMLIKVGYPSEEEEYRVLEATTGKKPVDLKKIISGTELVEAQQLVREVSISEDLMIAVNRLVRATRPQSSSLKDVQEWLRWGAGPRAGQALILTAKARVLLNGRYAVTRDDLRAVALPVLRHRILLTFKAEAEQVTTEQVIQSIVKEFLT